MKIPIRGCGGGLFAEFDDSDLKMVKGIKWTATRKPPAKTIYVTAYILGKKWTIHRWLLQPEPHQKVDHQDGNGLNNKRDNIRIATQSQNMGNAGPNSKNTSGYKGVYFWTDKRNGYSTWRAQLHHEGKRIDMGSFKTKEDAARAYDAKAIELRGEFAWTNFPREAVTNGGTPIA